MLEPGTVLGAKYRLECEIGRGGMGSVWRATRLDLGTELAIKVLHGEASRKPGGLERFTREAKAAASLTSPHVVRIIDFGVDGETGTPFMAMELLEGESLAARLGAGLRQPPAQVASVITQVARALGQAHAAGIIHRDLKPANIFLVRNADDELVKLLDFGIAKAGDGLSTATGNVLGTPYYMSPEQVSSRKDIDHRTDLWSLGVIACECLTGQRPFTAETLSELAMKIALGRADVPSSLAPVPVGFDAWFARATQVDPAQRFQSARELASALNAVAGQTSGVARAELELAATVASASAGSRQGEVSLQPEPQATAVLVATHADAALSTTSTGAAVPSRPGEMRGSRAWRRALWAGVPLGLGLLGATYSGLFESPRAPSIQPGVSSAEPAATAAQPTAAADLVSPTAQIDPPRPESAQPGDGHDSKDAGPPPSARPGRPRAAKLATEPHKTPRLRRTAPSSSTPPRTTAPGPENSPRSTSDTLDAYDLQ